MKNRPPHRPRINNLPYLKPLRKTLRRSLTPAEAMFWKVVQNRKFEGRKFRRQHSVGRYILDFYCPEEKLAVELDGEVHFNDAAREHDCKRKQYLQSCGIKVLRFENKLVFEDLDWVLAVIKSNFGWSESTTPAPPFKGGEFLGDSAPPFKGGEFLGDSAPLLKGEELLENTSLGLKGEEPLEDTSPRLAGGKLSEDPVSFLAGGPNENGPKNSPPSQGGVSEGRGG